MQNYQGDISILSNKKIEEEAKKQKFEKLSDKGLVVAEGEVTGHKHLLVADPQSDVEIAQDQFGYFIKVNKGSAVLNHEQHGIQEIGVGIHFIGSQWEYDELKERRVQD